jgi:putative IMPACT (imprinted ancient) family translation regulator
MNDDGEGGAANHIMGVYETFECNRLLVVVTRWFGGVKLGNVRFSHIR